MSGQIYISGGALRRTRIKSVPGTAVRPTLSMVREALFDILRARTEGSVFLDLFSGNGTVAIEALSRGAARAVLVERLPAALAAMRANLARLPEEFSARAGVVASDVAAFIKKAEPGPDKFDIIFLDPPYYREERLCAFAAGLVEEIFTAGLCAEGGRVVFQHEAGFRLPAEGPGFKLERQKKYGRTELSFFAARPRGEE